MHTDHSQCQTRHDTVTDNAQERLQAQRNLCEHTAHRVQISRTHSTHEIRIQITVHYVAHCRGIYCKHSLTRRHTREREWAQSRRTPHTLSSHDRVLHAERPRGDQPHSKSARSSPTMDPPWTIALRVATSQAKPTKLASCWQGIVWAAEERPPPGQWRAVLVQFPCRARVQS